MATEKTPQQICQHLVDSIAEITGEAWTFGYIGNLTPRYDDRCWYAFRPHPGRVGTVHDRIGGVKTEDLDQLVVKLGGAVAMARMLCR